ncbi:DoxX family protein [Zobellia galactanivorans]|uniref:DoxX family protein n=1 Tax=Zobellia galactanivorans (strain DSM 12802 / CCUG 47099 / CIP 106680 / NCIMB 13871 / Dsij) TaxID=63186 RepID=UPI0026E2DCA5|nr:DoxX family protein [Zobellia galactanivorans]MDO6809148.1 DoxX family protein [Zobellia galactanivorans]
MDTFFHFITEILILIFLIIVFIQSGIDKVFDWKGNLTWLQEHFSDTPLQKLVPVLLGTLLLMEMASGILCAVGLYQMLIMGESHVALYGSILSCITLLMLMFGQRLAKDYEGAKTIAVYFVPAIFLVYILQK